jgi:iron only hydrogenase large subunit-like protein
MTRRYPIYTESTDCRDCYKCVRQCSVKAIKLTDGRAAVMPERCIACGDCVHTCPTNAKKVRSDLARARNLLTRKPGRVIASLAPSYTAVWPELPAGALAGALKQLGFHAVSETALGAEAVTHTLAQSLADAAPGLLISTACPVVVDYIRKYDPRFTPYLAPMLSPMQAHTQLLRQHYGEEFAVVFIGPCIAKKGECDTQPGLTDLALTFADLATWLEAEQIDLQTVVPHPFEPTAARHGALYPIVGGMNQTLQDYALPQLECVAVSGMAALARTLDDLDPTTLSDPVFLEALACPGGCIGGPQVGEHCPTLTGELAVRKQSRAERPPQPGEAVTFVFAAQPQDETPCHEREINAALQRVGKLRREDELNCGGCGYETCRTFAQALVTHKAEPEMCLSHLRQLAQQKANALLRCMPSGVVIVDEQLHIIQCNENFARTAGADALLGYAARPGLEGADLRKFLPFAELFEQVRTSGKEFHCDSFRSEERLLNLTLFPIEAGRTVGGILLDVTQTENRRELIATKAKEVIAKNMATVQELACKLGEHMADTEILLRSIAEDYADTPAEHTP